MFEYESQFVVAVEAYGEPGRRIVVVPLNWHLTNCVVDESEVRITPGTVIRIEDPAADEPRSRITPVTTPDKLVRDFLRRHPTYL